ncbi:MAG: SdrD B-like domain-containing protein, partial [Bacteroidota bacterium]
MKINITNFASNVFTILFLGLLLSSLGYFTFNLSRALTQEKWQVVDGVCQAHTLQYEATISQKEVAFVDPATQASWGMTWANTGVVEESEQEDEVWVKDAFSSADLRFYTTDEQQLSYDIVLRPLAAIEQVQFDIGAYEEAYIDDSGALNIIRERTKVSHSPPYAYQEIDGEKIEVESAFLLEDGVLSFEVGAYDAAHELVIDPTVSMMLLAPCMPLDYNIVSNKQMITFTSTLTFGNTANVNLFTDGIAGNQQAFWWNNFQNIVNQEFLRMQFPTPTALIGIEMTGSFMLDNGSTYRIEGSNDGSNWTAVTGTQTFSTTAGPGAYGATSDSRKFPIAGNTTTYTYYRIFGLSGRTRFNWVSEIFFGVSAANQSGLANITCDQNGTTYAAADDFITFSLDPCGGTGTYTVSASGATIATPGGTLSASATGTFGNATFFRLGDGSAGGGNVTLTITGFDDNMDIVETVIDPGNCLPADCAGTDYNDLSNKSTITLSTLANTSGSGTIDDLKDGDITSQTFFFPSGTANGLEYIRVQFPQAEVLTGLEIVTSGGNPHLFNNGTNVEIQGSNNGSAWTTLLSVTEDASTSACIFGTCPSAESYSFPSNTTAYTFYRVFSVSGNGNNPWVHELFFQTRNPQSGLTNIVCNDGGTPFNGADDFLTFTLNPEGGTGSYNLIVDGYTPNPTTGTFGSDQVFTLPAGSAGNGDINIFIQNTADNCDIQETITDPGFCFPECGINISNAYVTCSAIDNYTLNFQVNWDYSYASAPPGASPIVLTAAGQSLANFQPTVDVGSQPFSVSVSTPTLGALITAEFQNFSDCNATRIIDIVPSITCAPAANCGFGGIGGNVFNDFDNDGVDDGDLEVGQGAIRVDLFEDNNNTPVATTYTNSNGDWLLTGFTNYPYRVEFSIPAGSPLETSLVGTDNKGDVQFLTTGSCDVDYGVLDPDQFTQNNPLISVVCFTRNNDPDTEGAIIFLEDDDKIPFTPISTSDGSSDWGQVSNFSTTNYPITYIDGANKGEVSTTLGLDWDVPNQRLLTGSYYRAFAPMATNSSSNGFAEAVIMQIPLDVENKTAGTPSVWLDLENCFGDDFAGVFQADNNYPGSNQYGLLGQYPEAVGAVGLGSIRMAKDFSELYVVNLNTNEVLVIPVNPDGTAASNASDIKRFPLPDTNCGGNWPDGRPYARALGLGVHPQTGRVYATLTCTGPNPADMTGYVYSFDPSDTTPSSADFQEELQVPLNIVRPYTNTNINRFYAGNVYSWVPLTPNTVPYVNNATNASYVGHISPWLAEIGFDRQTNGEYGMMIGERNRYTDQIASSFYVHGGALYRASRVNGAWMLENNGVSGDYTSIVNWTFDNSDKAGFHTSSSNRFFKYIGTEGTMFNGTFDNYQGSNEVISPAMDNISFNGTSGLSWLNIVNGERVADVRILSDETNNGFFDNNFAKANNWGGLAVMTRPSTIQVGNYVWIDADNDGIQDPGEMAVTGLTMKLYDAAGLLVGLDVTDASGEYYFDQTNVDITGVNATTGAANNSFTGLTMGEKYFIVLMADSYDENTDEITIGSTVYQLSPPDAGTGANADQNDSDASEMTIPGGVGDMPSIMFTTNVTDLTFDFGLSTSSCVVPSATLTPSAATCSGDMMNANGTITWTSDLNATHYGISTANAGSYNGPMTTMAAEMAPADNTVIFNTGAYAGATYIVRVFNGADDCFDDVTVVIPPGPPIPTIGDATVCEGLTTTITGSGTPAMSDPYVSNNMGIATVTSAGLVTGVSAGMTTITYTNSDGCTATSTITVTPLPTATLTPSAATCSGDVMNANGTITWTSDVNATHYGISTANAGSYNGPTMTGAAESAPADNTVILSDGAYAGATYIIRLFNTDDNCSRDVTVVIPAGPPIPTIGDATVCEGLTMTITGSGTPAMMDPYVSNDAGIATVTSAGVVTGVSAGMTTITYTNSDGCTATSTITVTARPTAMLSTTASTCNGAMENDNGSITWTSSSNVTHYGISTANAGSYNGATTTGTAQTVPADNTVILNDGAHAGASYIVRLFNDADNCTTDIPVTIPAGPTCIVDIFDLALIKELNTTATPGPFAPGDMVQFTITVTNQGNQNAFDVDVADYFNAAELSNPMLVMQAGVADNNDNTYTIDQIDAGMDVSFDITFTINPSFSGASIINDAEIIGGSTTDGGMDAMDADSEPNNNSMSMSETGNDNVITDMNNGQDQDDDLFEDDFDPAQVMVMGICPTLDPIADIEICEDNFTFPAITGSNLDGNEAYYSQPNGNGTKYLAGDMVTVNATGTFYAYTSEDALIRNTAGLTLWLDGQDVNADGSVPMDGTAIAAWRDKSGNSNDALSVSASDDPAYNASLQGVQFNSTDRLQGATGFNGNTLFVVFEPDNTITTSTNGGSLIGSTTQEAIFLGSATVSLTNEVVTFLNGGGGRDAISSSNLANITPDCHILAIRADGTNDAELYFDGTTNLQNLSTGGNVLFSNLPYAVGSVIGGGRHFAGTIKEIIAYGNTLPLNDFLAIQDLLTRKWNGGMICEDEESFRVVVPQIDVTPAVVCNNGTDFTVTVTVDWTDVDFANEDIVVSVAGQSMTINPTSEDGTDDAVFNFTSPSYDLIVSATLSNDTDCAAIPTAVDLIACGDECVDQLGGIVFNDVDSDGEQDAGEAGQNNILIEIYECNNDTPVATTYTNADGNWNVDLTGLMPPFRVEFTNPLQDYLDPSFAGSDNGTSVQFVDVASCTVDYGVITSDACFGTPDGDETTNDFRVITPCYINGSAEDPSTPNDALVIMDYDATGGSAPTKQVLATKQEIGTVWGIAIDHEEDIIYGSAFLKRHSGLAETSGASNPLGAIFTHDLNTGSNALWLDVSTLGIPVGTIPSSAARGLTNTSDPSNDAEAYDKVGKVGLGDIDIDVENKLLYVTNLNDNTVYALDIVTKMIIASYPLPAGVCGSSGEMRPWALKFHEGQIYVGAVCDASYTQNVSDLAGYVYRLNDGTWVEVADMTFDYPRELGFGSFCPSEWQAWTDQFPPNTCFGNNIVYPQPIISDIEFAADGVMILGIMDRAGHQLGFANYALTGASTFDNISAGDVLRALPNASGTWDVEIPATASGEFFDDDHTDGDEGSFGGLTLLPSTDEVLLTILDPAIQFSGGFYALDLGTGARSRFFEIYRNASTTGSGIGKAAGLGDIEVTCGELPIQIGNYVWIDTDMDGVQDACENPLPGLTVKLYTKPDMGNAELVATTTTDADGEYYFTGQGTTGETWETGFTEIVRGESYFIVFMGDSYDDTNDEITVGSIMYELTTADDGEGTNPDQNDSDVSEMTVPGLGDMPVIMFTADETDHTFDAGLIEAVERVALGNLIYMDNNEDGDFDSGTDMGIDNVTVELYNQGDDPTMATPVQTDVTENGGFYLFDNLSEGTYFVFIPASEFGDG